MATTNKRLWDIYGRQFRNARRLGREKTWAGMNTAQQADFLSFAMEQTNNQNRPRTPAKQRRQAQRHATA